MTNARQRRQIYRPLIERHPDLFQFDGYWLCLKPIRHVLLRVIIDRTSDANCCDPHWYVACSFLYRMPLDAMIGSGRWINRPLVYLERDWLWSDPSMVEELIGILETVTLPFLRGIDTFEKYVAFSRETFDGDGREWRHDRMLVDIALGDLETARKTWHELAPVYRRYADSDDQFYRARWTKLDTVAEPLLADDRPALARILHGWEAHNIRHAKLEAYWEPTPFPLERVG